MSKDEKRIPRVLFSLNVASEYPFCTWKFTVASNLSEATEIFELDEFLIQQEKAKNVSDSCQCKRN